MTKIKNFLITLIFVLVIGGFTVAHFALPDGDLSSWERRKLQQMPEITVSSLFDGSFMRSFETYLTDQFPLRDSFRTLKARFHFDVLGQRDNNDIYIVDGSASKLDRKISHTSVNKFKNKIVSLYDTYLKDTDCKVYFSVIPDKNAYLTEGTLYPHFDYEELMSLAADGLPEAFTTLDIAPHLSASSYYNTDSHWKQEEIVPLANYIRKKLGVKPLETLVKKDLGEFYGVYYGQSALPLEADRLFYLSNDEIDGATVKSIEKEGETKVYDMSKADALDRYDIFLSGAVSILEITNPKGEKGKELILFRDSFTSSLAPLLVPGYSKVTLIDIRYIPSKNVGNYVTFDNQDVIFIYGSGIVNNSSSLR
ncbi:MAG: hypothetical protein IIX36_08690 [Clostridia bacterium]|nr:hypothetical protein [Clostridia bacterium]